MTDEARRARSLADQLFGEAERSVQRLSANPDRAVENWENEESRIARCAERAAAALDIADYRITFDNGRPDGSPACWDERTEELRIHRLSWAQPWTDRERAEVIGHEMFHAYQWLFWMSHLVDPGTDGDRARAWNPITCPRAPIRGITGPEDEEGIADYVAYMGHPFERDARAWGRQFADTLEQEDELW